MHENRVLLAAMSLDLGGAETHVITLARELARRGYHVAVVSQGGRLTGELQKCGVKHYTAPLHSRSPLSLLRAIGDVSRIIGAERPALLHAHARIPAWVCKMAAAGRTPLVTTYHGVYAAGFPWSLVTVPGQLTVAVSEDVASHFVRLFGFDPTRIRVVVNGIDTSLFRPGVDPGTASARHSINGSPKVLHVSRLSGQFAEVALNLVPAIASLAVSHPSIQGIIVGDGDRLDEIKRLAAACNGRAGREIIAVTGGCEDMPPLYAAADVVVGVARVALEAMAMGKPVVLAGEGGLRGVLDEKAMDEVASHNFTARGSGADITSAGLEKELRRLLGDESLQAALGHSGRELVLERYSIEKMVDCIESVYNELS